MKSKAVSPAKIFEFANSGFSHSFFQLTISPMNELLKLLE